MKIVKLPIEKALLSLNWIPTWSYPTRGRVSGRLGRLM